MKQIKKEYGRKQKLMREEEKINEKIKREVEKNELLKSIKTEEILKKFLSELQEKKLLKVREIFEILSEQSDSFQKLHNEFMELNKKKIILQNLNYDEEIKKKLIREIERLILDLGEVSTFQTRERNKNRRERRRLARQLRKLEIRQAELKKQIVNIFNNTNYKSSSCRRRYQKACLRFAEWLSMNTGLCKVYNATTEHLILYVQNLQKIDYTKASTRTELYGILYLENFMNFKEKIDRKKILKFIGEVYE